MSAKPQGYAHLTAEIDAAQAQRDKAISHLVNMLHAGMMLADCANLEELNDKRRFCYAVECALGGLKGDYIEIIKELRKECGK
tara:strand:+ start:437 stop:685 length:249 start_codon:yes stop_codon:yes gene_type:complete